jgi:DNA-binding CsgD family transcriptional regulator
MEGLLARIAEVADQTGKPAFYPALLAALALHLKADLPMMMRYSAENAPEYIIHAGLEPEHMALYRRGLYRVDPIYRLCRGATGQGVKDLTEISTPDELKGDYFKIFLRLTGMADDLAILFPVEDRAAIGLVFERRTRFRREEIAEMRVLFPLLDSLHRLHQTLSRPSGRSTRKDPGLPPIDYRKAVDEYLRDELTPRERDIVGLILLGYPTAEIASRLKLSVNTIKNHKKRMYAKLDITTERELFLGFVNFLFES